MTKKPSRRVTTERVNTAFANYDAAAVEKFAAGAGAMLDGYHERTVAPLDHALTNVARNVEIMARQVAALTDRIDRLEAWLRLPWYRRVFRRQPLHWSEVKPVRGPSVDRMGEEVTEHFKRQCYKPEGAWQGVGPDPLRAMENYEALDKAKLRVAGL